MTKEQIQTKHGENIAYLIPWIHKVAWEMNLKDWEIIVSFEPCKKGKCASIDFPLGRKSGTIKLSSKFYFQKPEVQRQTIVHELVHLHFAPMHNALFNVLKPTTCTFYVEMLEYGVDAMADLIAPSMPLPEISPPQS